MRFPALAQPAEQVLDGQDVARQLDELAIAADLVAQAAVIKDFERGDRRPPVSPYA